MYRDSRSAEIKAGLLVVIAVAIFFGFLFLIAGVGLKPEMKKYIARFGYSNGIQPGSHVRLGGVLVGKVDKVYFPEDDKTRIEVLLSVKKDAPVRQNSEAFITSIGIMGDYYVEITPGSLDAPLLPDGSILQSKDVPSLVQFGARLSEPLERITYQLETLFAQLNNILTDQNTQHVRSLVMNMDSLVVQNQTNLKEITSNLAGLTDNLQELTGRIDTMMQNNSVHLTTALERFTSSMAHADSLLVELVKTTSQLNYILTSNETNFYEVLENLQDASDNFEAFSRRLKEQPWSLLRKSALPRRELPRQ